MSFPSQFSSVSHPLLHLTLGETLLNETLGVDSEKFPSLGVLRPCEHLTATQAARDQARSPAQCGDYGDNSSTKEKEDRACT